MGIQEGQGGKNREWTRKTTTGTEARRNADQRTAGKGHREGKWAINMDGEDEQDGEATDLHR
jgi:hypothetical protein